MRTWLLVLATVGTGAFAIGAAPARAAGATDHYPFCQLDGVTGATSCYFSTREQCGPRCISNPGYVGPARSNASGTTKRRARRY
jgi:hypothetical protein